MKRAVEVTIGLAVTALYAAFMAWIVYKAWPGLFDFITHAATVVLIIVASAALDLYHSIEKIPDYMWAIGLVGYVVYRALESLHKQNDELRAKLNSIEEKLLWINK